MWSSSILKRAHRIPLILAGGWALILFALCFPSVQQAALFVHWVRYPLWARFDNPEHYGLAPFKTRNFKIHTPDGQTLGAWHILFYLSVEGEFPPQKALSAETFERAILARPTVLYFHGNAGNRAAPFRVSTYSAFSTILDVNVIAIDYRGFGDSTGSPTETGVLADARAAWDYIQGVLERGGVSAASDKIVIAGQSLGTGVSALLAGQLATEGTRPRAIALIAPFSSALELVTEFYLFDFIPVLQPLKAFPRIQRYFQEKLVYHFDSTASLLNTSCPIVLAHSQNDRVIPHSHSSRLFHSLRNHSHASLQRQGSVDASLPVVESRYPGWGVVRRFEDASCAKGTLRREVVWWEGLAGGHNDLGYTEGVMDLIRRVANL